MNRLNHTCASLIVSCLVFINTNAQYVVPPALVEPLSPKGFRVSIPDDPDNHINIFAFHGHINKEILDREAGTFSRDITKVRNGRWTFLDTTTKLKPGDVINYWTYVELIDDDGRKLGFPNDDQTFTVGGLQPADNKPATTSTTTVQPADSISFPTEKDETQTQCTPGVTIVNGKSVCSKKIIFETSFGNNATESMSKWQKQTRFAGDPDYEFVWYNDDSRNIYIQDNQLHIKPTLTNDRYGPDFVSSAEEVDLGEKCTAKGTNPWNCKQKHYGFIILPPINSAKMSTRQTFSFKYGSIDIRAKLPKGKWIYPELYLNPKEKKYGEGYASGQIRIAFLPGNKESNTKLTGGCILGSSKGGRSYATSSTESVGRAWSDDFHIFSLQWKLNEIILLVDNLIYGRISPPNGGFASKSEELSLDGTEKWHGGTEFAPFDQEMYITIGVGVGGHSFPDDPLAKPWDNNNPKAQLLFYRAQSKWYPTWNEESQLIVDYIRVKSL